MNNPCKKCSIKGNKELRLGDMRIGFTCNKLTCASFKQYMQQSKNNRMFKKKY